MQEQEKKNFQKTIDLIRINAYNIIKELMICQCRLEKC